MSVSQQSNKAPSMEEVVQALETLKRFDRIVQQYNQQMKSISSRFSQNQMGGMGSPQDFMKMFFNQVQTGDMEIKRKSPQQQDQPIDVDFQDTDAKKVVDDYKKDKKESVD